MVSQQVDKVRRPQNSVELLRVDEQRKYQAPQQIFAFHYEAQRPEEDAWHSAVQFSSKHEGITPVSSSFVYTNKHAAHKRL